MILNNANFADISPINAADANLLNTNHFQKYNKTGVLMLKQTESDILTHFCFDLDGTLVDSGPTIYKAAAIILENLRIDFNVSEKDFSGHIGRHFIDIFNFFGIKVPDFDQFINMYKEKYFDLIQYSGVYPGVKETLSELKIRGGKISLLTTKVQDQADRIIDHFDFRDYFDLVMGRRDGIAHKPSAEPLLLICKELGVDIKNTLMTGDTELDIQCGRNAGSRTCGVSYGYRSKETLEKECPDYIISSAQEILSLYN